MKAAQSPTEPVRVVYIGGSGRSGSTVLARMIGQIPGFISVGETRELWRLGLGENQPCGCGLAFSSCPFWQRVGELAFGGWPNVKAVDGRKAVESFGYVDALRRLRPGTPLGHRPDEALSSLLDRLYRAIATAADGATIVDTSKGPAYAVALASVRSVDLRAIHLVRDSRGVAYSWSKEVPRPYTPRRIVKMHRLSALAATRWVAHHGLMELLSRRAPTTFMRYETLADHPREEVLRALQDLRIDAPPNALEFIGDHTVRLQPAHVVAGNPMRMATGQLSFELDAAWRQAFPTLQRAQVTAMTWPMLLRYGYRL